MCESRANDVCKPSEIKTKQTNPKSKQQKNKSNVDFVTDRGKTAHVLLFFLVRLFSHEIHTGICKTLPSLLATFRLLLLPSKLLLHLNFRFTFPRSRLSLFCVWLQKQPKAAAAASSPLARPPLPPLRGCGPPATATLRTPDFASTTGLADGRTDGGPSSPPPPGLTGPRTRHHKMPRFPPRFPPAPYRRPLPFEAGTTAASSSPAAPSPSPAPWSSPSSPFPVPGRAGE